MTYRERREARAERLRKWAEKREAKASAAHKTAADIMEMIPLGQPILVGHHSERRHRNQLAKIDRNMRAGIDNSEVAERMRAEADNIEAAAKRAIYSDDDDAIQRLEERIALHEAKRDRIKAYNASCRKGAPDRSPLEPDEVRLLDDCARFSMLSARERELQAFPAYVLSNLNGNVNRLKKRLEALKRRAS